MHMAPSENKVNISLICAFIFGWGLGMSLVATGAARPAGTAGNYIDDVVYLGLRLKCG